MNTEPIIITIIALTATALIGWRTYLWKRTLSTFLPFARNVDSWRRQRYGKSIGCDAANACRGPKRPHGSCVHCGTKTCSRGAYIETGTRKRRVGAMCFGCCIYEPTEQGKLRADRREHDWGLLTEPADDSHLTLHRMPEQYNGPTRNTIRAFHQSGAATAVVDGIQPITLNESIRRLELHHEIYAEQRDGHTVLRRVRYPLAEESTSHDAAAS